MSPAHGAWKPPPLLLMKSLKLLIPLIFWMFPFGTICSQTDDFNDADDSDWTRQDSIGMIPGFPSPFATFSFLGGAYRIQAPTSPAPGMVGPSRAASFRQDVTYAGKIFLSVDLQIIDPYLQQSVGFLAFVQPDPAPGAVSGYSLSYQPATGDIVLNRITDEVPTRLAYADLEAAADDALRLVLIAENGNFAAAVYNLDDLVNPIARLTATDSVFTTGTAGLFAFSDTDDATGPIDAVFDNYRANPISLPPLELTLQPAAGLQLRWPDWAVHFSPTSSTTLAPGPWTRVPVSQLSSGGGFLFHNGDRTDVPRNFFRLERKPL